MRVRKKKWAYEAIQTTTQCLESAAAKAYAGNWRTLIKQLQDEQAAQLAAAADLAPVKENTVQIAEAPLYLEIGCGKGKFICDLAEQVLAKEAAVLVGVDMEINAICFAAQKIQEAALPVALIYGSALELDEIFQAGEVNRIYLNFSTPWPKLKHHKRRLTHPLFLQKYLTILQDEGEIYLKTDNQDFYNASAAYFRYMGFEIVQQDENLFTIADPTQIVTEYEARWRGQGMPIYFLQVRKPEATKLSANQAKWQAADSPLFADEKLAYDIKVYRKHLQQN